MRLILCATWLVAAVTMACSSGGSDAKEQVSDLRAEVADVRAELRAVREELRDLRNEVRQEVATPEPPASPDGSGDQDAGMTATPEPTEPIATAEPVKSTVQVYVSSNPTGATVFLGQKKMGVTPVMLKVQAGSEELSMRLEKPGFRPRIMTIRPEEDTKLSVQLAKKRAGEPDSP